MKLFALADTPKWKIVNATANVDTIMKFNRCFLGKFIHM